MIFSIKIDKVTVNEISINKVKIPKNDLKNDPKSADFGSQNGPKIGFLGALKTWGAGPFFYQKCQFRRGHSAIFDI